MAKAAQKKIRSLKRIAKRWGPGMTKAFGKSKKRSQHKYGLGGRIVSPTAAKRYLKKHS